MTNTIVMNPAAPQLALYLKSLGHDVKWVCLSRGARIREELREADIPLHIAWMPSARVPRLLRPFRFIPATLSAARLFKRWRTQVVISFRYEADIVARIGGRLANVPVIISSIRNERFGPRSREILVRLTDRLATVTTTNSRLVAESLVARRVVPKNRLVVVPNSIAISPPEQPDETKGRVRASLGIGDREFLWLSVGRLAPQKDFPSLIRAMRGLINQHPNARLLIAGRGQLGAQLVEQVRHLGLEGCVQFLGYREDVRDLLTAADAFVLCSSWEGAPKAIIEAGAFGLPVVATDVGGVSEIVRHGTDGLLVPPGSVAALAGAMRAVMEMSPQERAAMGASARSSISQTYDPRRVLPMWADLIEEQLVRVDTRGDDVGDHAAQIAEPPEQSPH